MNKKLFAISAPMILGPYLVLFALAAIFFSSTQPFFAYIMETVFDGNALYLLAVLLLYYILIGILSTVCFILSIVKKWDAISLAKAAMIIKLAQIPAYVLIFVLAVFFVMAFFTIPFSIGLFLFDCLSVYMSGLLVLSSVITSIRNKTMAIKEVIWVILLQFVFCADVVSSVIFYIKLKKANQQPLDNSLTPPTIEYAPYGEGFPH